MRKFILLSAGDNVKLKTLFVFLLTMFHVVQDVKLRYIYFYYFSHLVIVVLNNSRYLLVSGIIEFPKSTIPLFISLFRYKYLTN